jgi:L-rhamnose mutarotase
MQRVAFQLRIREGMIEAYEEAHRNVWPELLRELEGMGVREYSIFRRGQQLFLYMQVPDFQHVLRCMAASEVNLRWQKAMAPLFEPVPGKLPEEAFAMMTEVFYMAGDGRVERPPAMNGTPTGQSQQHSRLD